MSNEKLDKILLRLENRWPVVIDGEHLRLALLRQRMQDFLAQKSVTIQGFSHFAIVFSNINASLALLVTLIGQEAHKVTRDWVEAYQVHVARTELQGTELELIGPVGKSFFAEFLANYGEGFHHLSFRVADIDGCLEVLKAKGVDLIDEKACSGSHGKVAFLKPGQFAPLHLELCQSSMSTDGNG